MTKPLRQVEGFDVTTCVCMCEGPDEGNSKGKQEVGKKKMLFKKS